MKWEKEHKLVKSIIEECNDETFKEKFGIYFDVKIKNDSKYSLTLTETQKLDIGIGDNKIILMVFDSIYDDYVNTFVVEVK